MFNNVKTLSVVVFLLEFVAFLCWGGYVAVDGETPFPGLLIIFGGSFVSWISVLGMYGFGQLIENTDKSEAENSAHSWRCDGGGNLISVNPCPHCGRTSDKE